MNKYLQYEASDFAQEQSFVRWVRMSNEDDISFWEEWIIEHPNKKKEVDQAVALVNQLIFEKEEVPTQVEHQVWSKINDGIKGNNDQGNLTSNTSKHNPSRGKIIRLVSMAAVAAMAIFFLMVNIGNDFDTTIQTPYASTKTINLPDGSVAHLNADSKLSYDSKEWNKNRMLELEGEAFFEVVKGSKFVVNTHHGEVEVLGTSFNVFARNHSFDVHCKTGKVGVTAASSTTILTPNQSVSVRENKHRKEDAVTEMQSRSNWQNGIYSYHDVKLSTVVKELERQLDIAIKIPDELKTIGYSGSFNTQDKESALSEVFWPLDLKYEVKNNVVNITK